MTLIVKEHNHKEGLILVITDANLIGKKFEEKNLQLDLTVKFYQGVEMSEEEIKKLIKQTYVLHLTGDEAVSLGVSLDLVNINKIIEISGIKHAEVLIEN